MRQQGQLTRSLSSGPWALPNVVLGVVAAGGVDVVISWKGIVRWLGGRARWPEPGPAIWMVLDIFRRVQLSIRATPPV